MTKTEIRKQMKGLNTALSSEQREELSARIFNEAERLPAFRKVASGAWGTGRLGELPRTCREDQLSVLASPGDEGTPPYT